MHLCCLVGSPAGLHTCWKAAFFLFPPIPSALKKSSEVSGLMEPIAHFCIFGSWCHLPFWIDQLTPSAWPGSSFWLYLGTATVPGWHVNTLCLRSRNPPCLKPRMRLLWPCSLEQPRSNIQQTWIYLFWIWFNLALWVSGNISYVRCIDMKNTGTNMCI